MAKFKTKSGKTTMSSAELLNAFKTNYGEEVGSYGGALINTDRIPTGLFPLDLALGGGFPRGRASTIYGPESSNKTNIALRAMAMHQQLWPTKTNIFFDIENSFNPDWAKLLGVDTEKVIVIKPAYAEQVVDMVESFLLAEDCGMVVIDSIAALITTSEAEASAERANVGGSGLLAGKLMRKSVLAIANAEKLGWSPTILFINQIRFKVGVMFGSPETLPGGQPGLYQASIILRVYGKNVIDKKVSEVMPVMKDVSFTVKKYKCPITAASGEFLMVTHPHDGLEVGQCDDFGFVAGFLKKHGSFEKDPKGWKIAGEVYPTQLDFKTKLYSDKAFGHAVRQQIIALELSQGVLSEDEGQFVP